MSDPTDSIVSLKMTCHLREQHQGSGRTKPNPKNKPLTSPFTSTQFSIRITLFCWVLLSIASSSLRAKSYLLCRTLLDEDIVDLLEGMQWPTKVLNPNQLETCYKRQNARRSSPTESLKGWDSYPLVFMMDSLSHRKTRKISVEQQKTTIVLCVPGWNPRGEVNTTSGQ